MLNSYHNFRSRCHKRKFFSMWSSVGYFRGQWSRDQNDREGQKSDDETRVQNPPSCVRLVVWQSQFGTPKSKITYVAPKTNSPTCWPMEVCLLDEWNHLLRVFNILNFSLSSCSHSLSTQKPNTMSKITQERMTEEGPAMAKSKPVSLISRSWSEFCVHKHLETSAGQGPEPSNEFSRAAAKWLSAFKPKETSAGCRQPTSKGKFGLPQHANLRQKIPYESLQKSSTVIESSREWTDT